MKASYFQWYVLERVNGIAVLSKSGPRDSDWEVDYIDPEIDGMNSYERLRYVDRHNLR